MPFTADQFFQVFERYNEAIWPVQIAAYLLGLLALAAHRARAPAPGWRRFAMMRIAHSRSTGDRD